MVNKKNSIRKELSSSVLKTLEDGLKKLEKSEEYLNKEKKKLMIQKEKIKKKISKEKEILRLKSKIRNIRGNK